MKYLLLSPDGDDGAGPSEAHSVFTGSDDPNDTGEEQQPSAAAAPPPGGASVPAAKPAADAAAPAAAAPSVLSAEEISRIVGESVRAAAPAQAAQPPKELSPEEFDKAFNMARVKQEMFQELQAAFRSDDPQVVAKGVKLLEDALQMAAKQAVTMNAYQLADLKDEILAQLQPLQASFRQQQEAAYREEFFTAYEDLEPWAPIVEAVATKLNQSGALKNITDRTKAFELVANEVRKIVKTLPNGSVAAPAAGRQPTPRTSKMSTLRSGGQGGTRQTPPAGTPAKSAGHAVFS